MNKQSLAYQSGYIDGLAWDLDRFRDIAHVAAEADWAAETINALGSSECADNWGVCRQDEDAWAIAIAEFESGCHAGVCAPQELRSGKPPRE
jgi:hypothetical protein